MLAKRIGAKITFLTVTAPFHIFTTDTQMIEDTPAQYKTRIAADAAKTLRAAIDAAGAAGVAFDSVQLEDEHPYQAIIDTAGSKDCDLIVMASTGATASRRSCSGVRRSRCSRIPKYLFSSIAKQGVTHWSLRRFRD